MAVASKPPVGDGRGGMYGTESCWLKGSDEASLCWRRWRRRRRKKITSAAKISARAEEQAEMAAMVDVGSEEEEEEDEEELGARVGREEVVEAGAPEVIAGRITLAVVVTVWVKGGWIVIVRVDIISMVVRALRTLVLVW